MFRWLLVLLLPATLSAACPFCDPEVLANQSAYETELFYVLADIAPVMSGHLLVVPKRHIMKAHEMTEKEWSCLSQVVPKVVGVFQKAYSTDQYIILEKNGPNAGQTVAHVHFHMLPMRTSKLADDAKAALFAKIFNQLPKRLSRDEAHAEALRLRSYFEEVK